MAANEHDCERNSVEDFETGELVCLKCGQVKSTQNLAMYVPGYLGRAMTASDHNAGNGLFNSQTENMDYISRSNMGLAFKLNRGGRDFQGRKVKTTLNDPYKSGNIAGGKELVMKEDPLTGELALKFDMYDKSMLRMVKERAMKELSHYQLSIVDLTIIARECKHIVSRLFFSELLDYAWMAAALNSGTMKPKDALALEQRLYELMEPIRIKLLSRCDTKEANLLREPPKQAIASK